ncbi:hypothetical protein [Pseudonocardia humida]|uniref:Uncharacterized protein n=1 Tax=Pseudonocardia humida TaxID=2800819 RepID=A0ABT0ZYQ1_9PSEU|nr:hypothetical protein [Pseudonocardia humida]MCO1655805.1 hypothetical protein [Pseudonocardia humida]
MLQEELAHLAGGVGGAVVVGAGGRSIDLVGQPFEARCDSGGIGVPGHRSLAVGQAVHLEYERAEQDGYRFRAVRAWPPGAEPVDPTAGGSSSAYRSSLTVARDDEPDR